MPFLRQTVPFLKVTGSEARFLATVPPDPRYPNKLLQRKIVRDAFFARILEMVIGCKLMWTSENKTVHVCQITFRNRERIQTVFETNCCIISLHSGHKV